MKFGFGQNFGYLHGAEPVGSEWWMGFPFDVKTSMSNWTQAEAARQGLPLFRSTVENTLRHYTRAAADGGGFVVGDSCYCPATMEGGVAIKVTYPASCPAGTGGVGGTPVHEMTVEELRESEHRYESLPKAAQESFLTKTDTPTFLSPEDVPSPEGTPTPPAVSTPSGVSPVVVVGGVAVVGLLAWLLLK